ncbi:uncharacterized protein METZ01_LOCUS246685 [marine metagenome]|uniref:Uncharacterized protein n=1 Tax=marine metagenome TaxID=408172 RepID=A0A382I545_9ZZZZ
MDSLQGICKLFMKMKFIMKSKKTNNYLFKSILCLVLGSLIWPDYNGSDIPEPIPLDIDINYEDYPRDEHCEDCNETYDPTTMGAECCDDAFIFLPSLTCEVLETQYYWNCSGCTCEGDSDDWTSMFGCADTMACNYDSEAFINYDESCVYVEDCTGECGGTVVEGECGVCGGSGIPEGACDCDGNVDLGCGCGETGPSGCDETCGSELEFDECGVCGGSGISDGDCDCNGNLDLGCGCGEEGPSGCDETCGSELEFDECDVCGGDGSSCETDCTELDDPDGIYA